MFDDAQIAGPFHIHLVSDSTGETLEAMAKAALVQFENAQAEKHLWPMVRTEGQLNRIMDVVSEKPGLVMYTLVSKSLRKELRRRCRALDVPVLDVLHPVIDALGTFLGASAQGLPGRQHEMDAQYFDRIDAMHYTMAHDDGQQAQDLTVADIVLVGVSRTSKTPTSIYLANKGFKTANVPYVPDRPLPEELNGPLDALIVGLTASPERLIQVRTNRLRSINEVPRTPYVDYEAVKREVLECRRFCTARDWPIIDVTRRSIEETAAAILKIYTAKIEGIERLTP